MGCARRPSARLSRKGRLLGCLAALIFAFVVSVPFLFVWAWSGSHCEPVPECQRRGERALAGELAAIVALAGLLGFAVRSIFNWRMTRAMGGAAGARPPLWAVASVAVLGLVGLYFAFGVYKPRDLRPNIFALRRINAHAFRRLLRIGLSFCE